MILRRVTDAFKRLDWFTVTVLQQYAEFLPLLEAELKRRWGINGTNQPESATHEP